MLNAVMLSVTNEPYMLNGIVLSVIFAEGNK